MRCRFSDLLRIFAAFLLQLASFALASFPFSPFILEFLGWFWLLFPVFAIESFRLNVLLSANFSGRKNLPLLAKTYFITVNFRRHLA